MTALCITFGALILVGLWELCRPRRRREFPAALRRTSNIGIWLANTLLAAAVFRPSWRGDWLPTWPFHGPASFVAAFLLFDLSRYAMHRAKHAVPLFWRFHALHHSDPDVDVTTAVRLHPIEYLMGSGSFWLAILLDIPAAVGLTYGLAVFVTEAVQHGNIRLPERVERWLQPVLVTVDTHRIHHALTYAQASCNYATVFSFWDRLFGTYTRLTRAQHDGIVFGVPELPRDEACRPLGMLLTPWRIK